jgi:hypothetical protein
VAGPAGPGGLSFALKADQRAPGGESFSGATNIVAGISLISPGKMMKNDEKCGFFQ